MNKTPREILDASFSERVPDDLNLFPRIAAQLQKGTQPMQPRMKSVFAVCMIVIVFAAIFASAPGVASAMRRMIGFVPGFGMVDQSAPIRMLAEPVSQTRDGMIVTITSAILTSERTVLTFSEENVPDVPLLYATGLCGFTGKLRLPDGTELTLNSGESDAGRARFVYGAIPANVDHASFVLPCLFGALPGESPENWELPLRFVPAPPEMTVVPVLELATATPAPTEPVTPTTGPFATSTPQVVVIEKALQMQDKLIFIGGFIPQVRADVFIQQNGDMKITDATGREIPYEIPAEELEMPTYTTPNAFAWVAQISNLGLAYPLTFTYNINYASQPDFQATVAFEMDVDQLAQSGPVWSLNRTFTLAGRSIKLLSVTEQNGPGGQGFAYDFAFACDPAVVTLQVETPNNPQRAGFGAGGNSDAGRFDLIISFEQALHGKVRVLLSHLYAISGSDTFQAQWSPEGP